MLYCKNLHSVKFFMSSSGMPTTRDQVAGGVADHSPQSTALGKRPAESQRGPEDNDVDDEQVPSRWAHLHAQHACQCNITCTCTQSPIPNRTGAVCSGAERQCPLAKKKSRRFAHAPRRAPSRNRKQPRATESNREQPRATESHREPAPLARLAPLACACHSLHFTTKPPPRDTG